MEITWYGTNALRIHAGGEQILVDPFLELRGAENPNARDDYAGADSILITHGHFDHLGYIPVLLEEGDYTVFCTKTPSQTLSGLCEDTSAVVEIHPGMRFSLGEVSVLVLRGKHIQFDHKLVLGTALSPRMLRFAENLPYLLWASRNYPEAGETLVYELEAEGKRIQILGSLGLCGEERYEPGADLLVMPYQGSSNPEKIAGEVLHTLRPRRVLLTHFDDAFPPISRSVPLRGLKKLLKEQFPALPVAKPKAGKAIQL